MTLASTVFGYLGRGRGESQFSEQISQRQFHQQGLWIPCSSALLQCACPRKKQHLSVSQITKPGEPCTPQQARLRHLGVYHILVGSTQGSKTLSSNFPGSPMDSDD